MNQVNKFGGNTTAVTDGLTTYLWNDSNGDGVVSDGDKFVRASQEKASVLTYVVGSGEAMMSWGDPHLDNITFTTSGEADFKNSLNALFNDATDGALNSPAFALGVNRAFSSNASRSNIGDFHFNVKVEMAGGGFSVEHEVAGRRNNPNIKVTDNIDVNLCDSRGEAMTLTIREVWAGNGGAGQMSIAETTGSPNAQAIADAKPLQVIHEWEGANVRVGVRLFGDDFGTRNNAHIVGSDGTITAGIGKVASQAIEAFDNYLRSCVTSVVSFVARQRTRRDDEPVA